MMSGAGIKLAAAQPPEAFLRPFPLGQARFPQGQQNASCSLRFIDANSRSDGTGKPMISPVLNSTFPMTAQSLIPSGYSVRLSSHGILGLICFLVRRKLRPCAKRAGPDVTLNVLTSSRFPLAFTRGADIGNASPSASKSSPAFKRVAHRILDDALLRWSQSRNKQRNPVRNGKNMQAKRPHERIHRLGNLIHRNIFAGLNRDPELGFLRLRLRELRTLGGDVELAILAAMPPATARRCCKYAFSDSSGSYLLRPL
jgi:hypothetical protein